MNTIYCDIHSGSARPAADRPAAARPNPGRVHAEKWSNQAKRNAKPGATRNAYPGQGTAPLSRAQMARICILARTAFDHVFGKPETRNPKPETPGPAAELTQWRRAEQERCTGRPSLTVCTQADYLALVAHFAHLAGEDGAAYVAHTKDATGDVRVAMHKLHQACAERGLSLAYPAAICRSRCKCQLEDATARQLWQLVFTVRNRKEPGRPRPVESGDKEGGRGGDKESAAADPF